MGQNIEEHGDEMKVVIVGNGPGGFELAKQLSQTYEVTVIDKEPVPYYSKPMLSHYIAGFIPRNRLFPYSLDWYRKRGIEIRLAEEAKLIDRGRKVVITEKGEVPYDTLVLATGARAREPQIKGKEYLLTLRTIFDADRIKESIENSGEAIIIGGGFIGLELAGNLAEAGYHVKLIHRGAMFLGLDEELSNMIKDMLEETGVKFFLNSELLEANEEGVLTNSGFIEGKVKICAIGIVPNVDLARRSGIHTGRGILIDDNFRTSAKDVYAIGDCAEYSGIIAGTAKAAMEQARVLADILKGEPRRYNFKFRSTVFKFGKLQIAIIGNTKGEGKWIEDNTKVFYENGKIIGAVVFNDIRKATKLEKEILDFYS